MLTTALDTNHPFPYMRDCLDSWDRLDSAQQEKLVDLFGGKKFLDMIEEKRLFLRLIEALFEIN